MTLHPLVVELGTRTWGWVEKGRLWVSSGGPWAPVTDYESAPGVGGRVLTEREVSELIKKLGRPT